jgi:hypothetical protein
MRRSFCRDNSRSPAKRGNHAAIPQDADQRSSSGLTGLAAELTPVAKPSPKRRGCSSKS